MKYTLTTLILLSGFLQLRIPAQNLDQEMIYQWLEEAYQYQDSGKYDSAIYFMARATASLEDPVNERPDSASSELLMNLQYELSKLYIYQRDYTSADSILQIVITVMDQEQRRDTLYGEVLHNLGMLNMNRGTYDQARDYLDKALQIKVDQYGEIHASVANTYNALGNLVSDQGNFEKAREYYEHTLEIRKEVLPEDHMHIADTYQNLGILEYSEGDYDKAIEFMVKGFEIEKRILPPTHPNLASTYNNLGVMYDLKGDYERALEFYQNALDIRKEILGEQHPLVAESHLNMGVVRQEHGDLREALDNYIKALYIFRNSTDIPVSYELASTLDNIGSVYAQQQKYREAINYHQQSMEMNVSLFGETHPDVAGNLFNLAQSLISSGDYHQARAFLERAENINRQMRPDHPDRALVYSAFGELYALEESFDKSINSYERAIDILTSALPEKHPLIAKMLNDKANIYVQQADTLRAISTYHKAILSNLRDYDDRQILSVPPVHLNPVGKPEYLESLHQKALLLYSSRETDEKALSVAVQTWETAFQILDNLQADYSYRQSKLDLSRKAREVYEAAMQANIALYEQTSNSEYLNNSFRIAERAQSALLHEWIQDVQARQQSGIPEELLEEENQLRIDISFYEKQLYELQSQAHTDSLKLLAFRARLFDARRTRDSLVSVIEKRYPEYFEMKYQRSTVDIKDLQQLLQSDEMVIRYFMTPGYLYTFTISPDQFDYDKQPVDSTFIMKIVSLYKSFQDYNWDESNWDQQLNEYARDAYSLYGRLLEPSLGNQPQKIRIIPDGILGFIPFEALISKPVQDPENYHVMPFIIKEHEVSYAYSAQLLMEVSGKTGKKKHSFIGFAPDYGKDAMQLAALRADRRMDSTRFNQLSLLTYNKPEVEELSSMMGGKAYLGEKASEEIFKQVATRAGIIHMAMHTLLDDRNPLYSGLVFSQDEDTSREDNFLHTYELFNMDLEADLVVLSACNSGIGESQQGEGMLSLARAFRYAGCPNLVMTLWQTDDRAAYHMMKAFYDQLDQGLTYAEALREAKMDYLSNHDQVHPFYWANFIYMGENKALPNTSPWWIYGLLGLIVLGSIVSVSFFRKK